MDWFHEFITYLLNTLSEGGPQVFIALFLLTALMEVGIPFPFLLDTAIFLTSFGAGLLTWRILFLVMVLLSGRIVGASVFYWLSRAFGAVFIHWLERHRPHLHSRFINLTEKIGDNAVVAVAIARLTPGLLLPSTVASGAICMHYPYFVTGIAISSLIADGILLLLGFIAKTGFAGLGQEPPAWAIFLAMLVSLGIVWVLYRYVFRRIGHRRFRR